MPALADLAIDLIHLSTFNMFKTTEISKRWEELGNQEAFGNIEAQCVNDGDEGD